VTEHPKSHEPASASEPIVFVSDDDASKLPDVARLAIVENTAERECYPVTRADLPIKIEFILRSD